ncbi:MAG: hypothetical protein WC856_17170 [Methylococcaceae bacterium]|jgi:hypothetical protein
MDSGNPCRIDDLGKYRDVCTEARSASIANDVPPSSAHPTSYTGDGTAYILGGILGASFAPYIAQRLVTEEGLAWVGGYVSLAAAISLLAVYLMWETRDNRWV